MMRTTDDLHTELIRHGIPARMHGGLLRWVEQGIEPGDFLRAVLRNDLRDAATRADDENVLLLRAYVWALHAGAPSICWGSQNACERWRVRGGLRGIQLTQVSFHQHSQRA